MRPRLSALVAVLLGVLASTHAFAAPAEGKTAGASAGASMPTSNTIKAEGAAAEPPPTPPNALEHLISRPHTIAEFEAGIIALPNAPISNAQKGGDTPIGTIGRGDATMQTGLHVLYRFHQNYVIGAGVIFSPFGTTDDQYGGGSKLTRTHTRSYLFMGAEGRYVPLRYKSLEGWFGVSGGAVIVADRFHTEAPPVPPILGVPDSTIRTEGFAIGVQAGLTYYLSENWIAGANLRGYHWILPEGRQCSPIGDCATLAGSLEVFELGLTIGYRLPL